MNITELSVEKVEQLIGEFNPLRSKEDYSLEEYGHEEDYDGETFWHEWAETEYNAEVINGVYTTLPAKSIEVPELGFVQVVECFGGEGLGEQFYLVFKVTSYDVVRHFKLDGYYASYDGGSFDGPFTEVSPKEKTIIVWE